MRVSGHKGIKALGYRATWVPIRVLSHKGIRL